MRTTAGVVTGVAAVAAMLLTGCDSDPNEDTQDTSGGGGSVASLTGDALCAMVDTATIEEQFGESIQDEQGGREPEEREAVSCSYVTDSMLESDVDDIDEALAIGTSVRTASENAGTAQEALDAYMVDRDGQTVAYTPVDGLGAAAGYAPTDLLVRLGQNHLVAILEIDDKFIEVITKTEPEGTMDQLRPIADELVAGVESELG